MIELIIAVVLIVLSIGSIATLFATGDDSSFSSQRELSEVSVLQQQIERVRQAVAQFGFNALALTSSPSAATDAALPVNPSNPDDFVGGSGCSKSFTIESNYNNTTEGFPTGQSVADSPEPLLVNGCTVSGNQIVGGQLAPVQYVDLATGTTYGSPGSVPTGDTWATVYTFVTQTDQVGCNGSGCTGDGRRVILAVLPNHASPEVGQFYPVGSSTPNSGTPGQCGTIAAPSSTPVAACATVYSSTVFTNPAASNGPGSTSGLRILGLVS